MEVSHLAAHFDRDPDRGRELKANPDRMLIRNSLTQNKRIKNSNQTLCTYFYFSQVDWKWKLFIRNSFNNDNQQVTNYLNHLNQFELLRFEWLLINTLTKLSDKAIMQTAR